MNAPPTLAPVALLDRIANDVSHAFTGNLALCLANLVFGGPALMTVELIVVDLAAGRSALSLTLTGLAFALTFALLSPCLGAYSETLLGFMF